MATPDFDAHRAGIENLLREAKKLSEVDQDRLRWVVRHRRDPERAMGLVRHTDLRLAGERLLAALQAADAELQASEVAELERLIDTGLAEWPAPPKLRDH